MPQVKVWCQRMGCDVSYATHFSQAPLLSQPPTTLTSSLSIAAHKKRIWPTLSRYYQKRGCLRSLEAPMPILFRGCRAFLRRHRGRMQRRTIREILVDRPRGVELSSEPPQHFPTVEERMEDIRSAFSTVATHYWPRRSALRECRLPLYLRLLHRL